MRRKIRAPKRYEQDHGFCAFRPKEPSDAVVQNNRKRMTSRRLVYVIMNFPVGGLPYVDAIFKANQFLTKLYAETQEENAYLSKRDLERLGIHFPPGPRYKIFGYYLPDDFMTRKDEPTGYTYTDYLHMKSLLGEEPPKEGANPPKLE